MPRRYSYLKAAITKPLDLKKIAAMVKTRIEVFPDIAAQVDFFETLPEYDPEMYVHKKMKTTKETSLETLKEVLPLLEAQEDYSDDALYETLAAYVAEGRKNRLRDVAHPHGCFRKADDPGRSHRDHGGPWKRGVPGADQ